MYTLHAVPLTCSLAVHLVLADAGAPFTVAWAARGPGRLAVGDALVAANPKRKVPTLVLPDGEVLTEIAAVLGYLDERHGPSRSPAERRRLAEWLAFTSTELHKQVLAPAFDPGSPAEAVADARARLLPHVLAVYAGALAGRSALVGDSPSGADAYLWWGLVLLGHLWPADVPEPLVAWRREVGGRPSWRRVLGEERALLTA